MRTGTSKILIILFFALALTLFTSYVLAGNFESSSSPSTVESGATEVLLNFTINNNATGFNLTNVTLQLPSNFTFITDTNSTTGISTHFTNTSSNITWGNISTWIIGNGTGSPSSEFFVFNVSVSSGAQTEDVLVFTVHEDMTSNSTTVQVVVNDSTRPSSIDYMTPTPAASSFQSSNTVSVNVTFVDINPGSCIFEFSNGTAVNYTNSIPLSYACSFNFGAQPSVPINVTVFVNDSSGNINSSAFLNFTIDATQPSAIDFLAPTPTESVFSTDTTPSVNVTFTETNFANCTIVWYNTTGAAAGQNLTNTASNTSSCSLTIPTQASGEVNTTVFVYDAAGNANTTVNRNWTIDATQPSAIDFSTLTPAAGAFDTDTTPIVNVTFTETNVVSCVMTWYNVATPAGSNTTNTTIVGNSCMFNNISAQSEGEVNVTVFVNDAAGNSNLTTNRNWTVDSTGPSAISFSVPTDGSFQLTSAVTLYGAFAETNAERCIFEVSNTTSNNINYTNSTPGSSTCTITLTFASGNVNATLYVNDSAAVLNSSTLLNFTVDATLPSAIDFLAPTPAEGAFSTDTTPSVNVTFTETNFANCTITWYNTTGAAGGQNFTNTASNTSACSLTLPTQSSGEVNTTVFVYDAAGNANATENRNWTVDSAGPSAVDFSTLTPAEGAFDTDTTPIVNVTFTETNAINCTMVLYNTTTAAGANVTNSTLLGNSCMFNNIGAQPQGELNVTVFVYDAVGNVNTTVNRNWTIDSTLPTAADFVSPTPAEGAFSTSANPIVTVVFTEINPVNCTITWYNTTGAAAGQNFTNTSEGTNSCSFNATTQSSGEVNVTIFTHDAAGNVNATVNRNWTVDTVLPAAIDFVSPMSAANANVTVPYVYVNATFTETFANSCTVQIANASVTNFTGTISGNYCFFNASQSTDGPWNFTVYLVDAAGNTNSTITRTVNLNLNSPEVVINSPSSNNSWYNASFVLNTTAANLVWITQYRYENVSVNSSWVAMTDSNISNEYWNATFNISTVVEGNYTFRINATDSDFNSNTTETMVIWIDTTNPTISAFSLSSATPTVGATVTGTCTATDNLDTSVTTVITGIDTTSTGSKTATCTAVDNVGNVVTSTASYTVSAAAGGGGGGGAAGGNAYDNKSKKHDLIPGKGLQGNTKLQTALEKVLGKGKMNENAIQNLMRLSESIVQEVDANRVMSRETGKTRFDLTLKYKGQKKIKNLVVWDKLPKAFAAHTDNISVNVTGATIEIVETDPEYLFVFDEVAPQQEIVISYEVARLAAATTVDDAEVEIYAEGLEEVGDVCGNGVCETGENSDNCLVDCPLIADTCNAGEKRCSGNSIQECIEDGTDWRTIDTCQHGCANNVCVERPAADVVDYMLLYAGVLVVIIIIIIIVLVVLHQKRKF
ncbi:MAG: hypothetical protein ABIJ92_02855 [Candidatus Aenigmatarchaeota archaeon]